MRKVRKSKWPSLEELLEKQKAGKIRVILKPPKEMAPQIKPKVQKIPRSKPTGLVHIINVLMTLREEYKEEHMFLRPRRYRFDVALVQYRIAIEYEGLMSEKSRHTTKKGYTGDATKYNQAQIAGWIVLRYTADNYKEFDKDFEALKKTLTTDDNS
jgi:hypothetical protein